MSEMNEENAAAGVAGHNVENRKQILVNSLAEMWKLDKEIDYNTEKHLSDLRAAKSAITKRIREDLNMPAKVFKARYASYKIEAAAVEAEDDVTLDAIREMNEMAPIGSQINMLDAVEGFEDPEPPQPQNPTNYDPDDELPDEAANDDEAAA